jgi:predicted transcriptional regulator
MERKRSRMEIISDMLAIVQGKNGSIKPTHLMYKANLSHSQMKSYLDELIGKNLIKKEETDKGRRIAITKSGKDILSQYSRLREFEKTFGL